MLFPLISPQLLKNKIYRCVVTLFVRIPYTYITYFSEVWQRFSYYILFPRVGSSTKNHLKGRIFLVTFLIPLLTKKSWHLFYSKILSHCSASWKSLKTSSTCPQRKVYMAFGFCWTRVTVSTRISKPTTLTSKKKINYALVSGTF